MRSSLGVRFRVWLRIQDSGTRQRAANSVESINSRLSNTTDWDINGTLPVSVAIESAT
jgi:hypothetical protein